jgi:hypothetical protein
MNDDESDVSRMLRMIAAVEWLSIRVILRVSHWCVEMNSFSEIETESETETETRSWVRSSTSATSDWEKLRFEMLRFVMLTTLVNESRSRSDWDETCLFTNNASFCSKCVVSEFREIRDSIDLSWIFALLTLTVSIWIVWARFVSLTTLLFEARWVFVNVRSSLEENMTISLRLNFAIHEASCVTTLMRMIIWRLCFLICVIIVCQFKCVDEIIDEIIKCCTTASTKMTAKKTTKAIMRTMTKMTRKEHWAESDDVDFDTDSDETDSDADSDDVDSRDEILFWESFWVSFWNARSSSLSTLLNEKWAPRNDEQSMTTNLINVCLTE